MATLFGRCSGRGATGHPLVRTRARPTVEAGWKQPAAIGVPALLDAGCLASPVPVTEPPGVFMTNSAKALILEQVAKYHREMAPRTDFVPGVTPVWPSGAVLDESDRVALVEAALDMRIAAGVTSRTFERKLAKAAGLRKAHMTNSGSSANLLALSSLTSPALGDRRMRRGDEVITVAA